MTETDLRTVARHESAHLLALLNAPHLGAPTAASIVPDSTTAGGVTWPGLRTVAREHVEDAGTFLLAGLAAEEHARGEGADLLSIEEHGSGADTRDLAELLVRHRITGTEADALVARAVDRARAFVRAEWRFLERVADALVVARTFDAATCAAVGEWLRAHQAGRAEGQREAMQLALRAFAQVSTEKAVERARKASKPGTGTGRA